MWHQFSAAKQDKVDMKDNKEKPRKSTGKKTNSLANPEMEESAIDPFGPDLLPLDGKDEFGDLLDVFDANETFHEVDVKPSSKNLSSKKVAKI